MADHPQYLDRAAEGQIHQGPTVVQAMLQMDKIDIKELKQAYEQ